MILAFLVDVSLNPRFLKAVPTSCHSFDQIIRAGFPRGYISLIYGEADTGKTTIAIQCAINCARRGLKTIFIDSDNTFSSARLSQMSRYDLNVVSPRIIIFAPKNFKEQSHLIESLDRYLATGFMLTVVDTISSLYRLELGSSEETFALNRELNRQLAYLAQLAKTRKIAVLLTSQVHSVISEAQVEEVEPIATRVLKFWSSAVVRLKQTPGVGVREAVLEKFLGVKRPHARCYFKLTEAGIQDLKH